MTKHIDNFSTAGRLEIIFPFDMYMYRFLSAITLIVIHVKSHIDLF